VLVFNMDKPGNLKENVSGNVTGTIVYG
jgi:hypothetical protein